MLYIYEHPLQFTPAVNIYLAFAKRITVIFRIMHTIYVMFSHALILDDIPYLMKFNF